jgi:Repeat of unknown function (DUF5648)
MKTRSAPDLSDSTDYGNFDVIGDEIYASFLPSTSVLKLEGSQLLASQGVTAAGQNAPDSVVAMTSGGMTINLLFDAAATAAPASFRAGIQQAAALLTATISDHITVNIKIDYSGTGGGAAAGPDRGLFESYSSIRTDLISHATTGDTIFDALPSGSSVQGQSNVVVWNAQLKLWGLLAANDTTTDDGSATFATDINSSSLVGVALHELTHALGRIQYGSQPDIFDLFRFTSSGTRLFSGGATAPATYFSADGGTTKLADFGQTSDASDFLNSGVQGANDPFNEFYSGNTGQSLTSVDKQLLDALGYHVSSSPNAPSVAGNTFTQVASSNTATLSTINRMERFFDTATGDHFYTLSEVEANQIRATLPTYHDEGAPWGTTNKGPNTIDVYRFFDAVTGAHFLTSSAAERDQVIATLPSYHYEGVAFEAYNAPGDGTLTLERFFNTQTHLHHYAASPAEIASILSGGAGPGWVDEGAGFIVHA